MTKDRRTTEKKILRAVGRILAGRGFRGFGVNAVAKEAGVDKVLIYRYFGGMPALLRAYARAGTYWPTIEEVTGGDPGALARRPRAEAVSTLLCNFAGAIRKRPVTLEILAWESIERNEMIKVLEKVREEFTRKLSGILVDAGAREEVDMAAVVALLSAGINYLAVRSRKVARYGDVGIRSEEGWGRIESAVRKICGGCIGVTST